MPQDSVAELRKMAGREQSALYSQRLVLNAAADEIERMREVMNRIANGCRFPSNDFQRALLKVTTEVLGSAYKPFDVKMPEGF